jgi:ABC-type dipeptide/oligopeptide/nickel transport system ATPase component
MNLLDIQDLRTYFHTDEGVVKAVDDVSLQLEEGHTLGIVGESGSGKSVTSLSIMRLLAGSAKIETGRIAFLGQDLVGLPEREMRKIRGGNISMIFQPFCSIRMFPRQKPESRRLPFMTKLVFPIPNSGSMTTHTKCLAASDSGS